MSVMQSGISNRRIVVPGVTCGPVSLAILFVFLPFL